MSFWNFLFTFLIVTKMFTFNFFVMAAVFSVVADQASGQVRALGFGLNEEGPCDLPLWDRDMAPHVQQSFRTLVGRSGNVSPEKNEKKLVEKLIINVEGKKIIL